MFHIFTYYTRSHALHHNVGEGRVLSLTAICDSKKVSNLKVHELHFSYFLYLIFRRKRSLLTNACEVKIAPPLIKFRLGRTRDGKNIFLLHFTVRGCTCAVHDYTQNKARLKINQPLGEVSILPLRPGQNHIVMKFYLVQNF